MENAALRDIVIIVFGIAGTIFFLLTFAMVFLLYHRLKHLYTLSVDSLAELRSITCEIKEVVKPMFQIMAIIEVAAKSFDFINNVLQRKKGGRENESGTVD